MKAIITKYTTTKGPVLMDGALLDEDPTTFQSPGDVCIGAFRFYYHGNDWHKNKRDARDDVLDRFRRKHASLRKQIESLQAKRDKALKAIEGMELP